MTSHHDLSCQQSLSTHIATMASKRASSRPRSKPKAEAVSATSAGIVKVKPKKTTVRRLKNGLIDVSFKAAEHANA